MLMRKMKIVLIQVSSKPNLIQIFLEFEKFFDHKECKSLKKSKYKTFKMGQTGGRIISYKSNFLLTHGSYSEFDDVQNDNHFWKNIINELRR